MDFILRPPTRPIAALCSATEIRNQNNKAVVATKGLTLPKLDVNFILAGVPHPYAKCSLAPRVQPSGKADLQSESDTEENQSGSTFQIFREVTQFNKSHNFSF